MWIHSNLFLESTQFTHFHNLALIIPSTTDCDDVCKTGCCDSGEKVPVVTGRALGCEAETWVPTVVCQPFTVRFWHVPSSLWAADDHETEVGCQLQGIAGIAYQLCCYVCNDFPLIQLRI